MNALNKTLIAQNTSKEISLSLPCELKAAYPLSSTFAKQIAEHRQTIQNILSGKDSRLLVVSGPCSIHDPVSAL